jgi:hypothetical protein
MEDKNMPQEEKMSPEMCVKAGKCMMKEMMDKMGEVASKDEYDNMPDEEKDKADEEEVMGKEEKE